MADWKTEGMLSGIKGVLDLTASFVEDLATSDIVTDALTAFDLSMFFQGFLLYRPLLHGSQTLPTHFAPVNPAP